MPRWRTRGWLLPVALAAGVLGIAVAEAVLLRHKQVPAPAAAATRERIGLVARPDGDALELEWDHGARPIVNADHAIVYIQDGKYKSQLQLTGQQMSTAKVRYWPESKEVSFRMEVYRGTASTSDTVQIAVTAPSVPLGQAARSPGEAARLPATRAVVEKVNPSPFVRPRPRVVRVPSPHRAPAVVPVASAPKSPEAVHPEPARVRESGLSRVVSKIPLLRRLKKHPQSADSARFDSERPADKNLRP